ncbi:hypothetical protein PPL_11045 [Heterostelium album PN500]|uniref:Large ribosomal subunit protein uL18 C-terminal eukaryotes domain-containing protein n=1 Tax=Heterostelium pallidum (strain ATCC 26659 / Pp 5 / PN500) TaxID=670386 RepID=D3BSS5_HETP5|nr:hypothetical protein PPL_11045 [Heterostelium album PN500]EFA75540.1 hypothetical protein PPL_11045 [Heterostelium album PN500]|eukprot:XP_020427674.1 hypothetical protein PPL_11045 [Heterostelium album PN500]
MNSYQFPKKKICVTSARVMIDVGLARTTTGNKVFAVLKGACDGGMYIPHKKTRFVGYNAETKKLNAEVLKKYIFGGHVAEHMKLLQTEDEEEYKRHYSQFIKAKVASKDLEAMCTKAHVAIRKDPSAKKADKKNYKNAKFAKKDKRTLTKEEPVSTSSRSPSKRRSEETKCSIRFQTT